MVGYLGNVSSCGIHNQVRATHGVMVYGIFTDDVISGIRAIYNWSCESLLLHGRLVLMHLYLLNYRSQGQRENFSSNYLKISRWVHHKRIFLIAAEERRDEWMFSFWKKLDHRDHKLFTDTLQRIKCISFEPLYEFSHPPIDFRLNYTLATDLTM